MLKQFCYWFVFFIHFIIPFGKLGSTYLWVRLQQPQEQSCPVLQVHAGPFHVSVIPPNSDMDYRIVNVLTWSFWHTRGLGTPTSHTDESFLTRGKKLTHFSCVLDRGSNLGYLNLESDALPIEPPRHPRWCRAPTGSWGWTALTCVAASTERQTDSNVCY